MTAISSGEPTTRGEAMAFGVVGGHSRSVWVWVSQFSLSLLYTWDQKVTVLLAAGLMTHSQALSTAVSGSVNKHMNTSLQEGKMLGKVLNL